MKHISEVSITTSNLNNHFDVFRCFLNSADTLRQTAYAGIALNVLNDHLVTAFFLFRHSIELAIKALIEESTAQDIKGHNLKKMWENDMPDYKNIIPDKIDAAFALKFSCSQQIDAE